MRQQSRENRPRSSGRLWVRVRNRKRCSLRFLPSSRDDVACGKQDIPQGPTPRWTHGSKDRSETRLAMRLLFLILEGVAANLNEVATAQHTLRDRLAADEGGSSCHQRGVWSA